MTIEKSEAKLFCETDKSRYARRPAGKYWKKILQILKASERNSQKNNSVLFCLFFSLHVVADPFLWKSCKIEQLTKKFGANVESKKKQ